MSSVTGKTWNAKAVLNEALSIADKTKHRSRPLPTLIEVAPPRSTQFGLYVPNTGDRTPGDSPFKFKSPISYRRIPLYGANLAELLLCGETDVGLVSTPDCPDGKEDEYIWIMPIDTPLRIDLAMVGITGRNLKKLASSVAPVNQAQNQPTIEPTESERPISTRERNTLLKIIRALCVAQDLDLSKPYKAAEVIKTQLEKSGDTMDDETIAKKLIEAKKS